MKPVVLIVMDGIGIHAADKGNAVTAARTPNLDFLLASAPHTQLKAHGTAVGLPSDDDMGNSEVGHNAIGCGQIYSQGAKLVNESIASGAMYKSAAWVELVGNVKEKQTTLHFIGLLSDGNVHSHIDHLKAMLNQAKTEGAKRVRIHILLDGRDVPARSALEYVTDLEKTLAELNDGNFDAKIASGGGRMKVTMDRYEADWGMVEKGWQTHVCGKEQAFANATEAINTLRAEHDCNDQDLPPFVISENGEPVGKMVDGDSVILFNFRGDRAQEISRAFDNPELDKFARDYKPNVMFAGMLQYDGDAKIPARFLVEPPQIRHTLSEFLVKQGVKQYAVSETQKYGHVTYFWNGNRNEKFSEELEVFEEIPSDRISFDERPWMKCAEITDRVIAAIQSGEYGFIRANFPNGDMVGHTGNFEATVIGVEAVDLCLARIIAAVKEAGAILVVTADHGNADEMIEKGAPKTAHTLNPVPFIIYNTDVKVSEGNFGLANIAATVAKLMGLEKCAEWKESII